LVLKKLRLVALFLGFPLLIQRILLNILSSRKSLLQGDQNGRAPVEPPEVSLFVRNFWKERIVRMGVLSW
jgi:hypothetical protein